MKKVSMPFLLLLFIVILFAFLYFTNIRKQKVKTTTMYLNDSKVNSLENPENNIEQYIYELIEKSETDDKTKKEIFSLIKNIDWKKLNNVNENAAIKLLDWLDKSEISSETDIENLLKATKGLDGAIAEKYSTIISNLYLKDKRKFIKCLSELPIDNIDFVCSFVAYGCSYGNLKQILDDTNKLLNTEKLSNQEKIAVEKLIESLKMVLN